MVKIMHNLIDFLLYTILIFSAICVLIFLIICVKESNTSLFWGTMLCLFLFFLSMMLSNIVYLYGWEKILFFLGIICIFDCLFKVKNWTYLSNIWLSVFAGFATGLLQISDVLQNTHGYQTIMDILYFLPKPMIGYLGIIFYLVFIGFLPKMVSHLAQKIHEKYQKRRPIFDLK